MTSIVQNNFIQAYLDANKLLVKTLIVKSSFAAYAINQKLVQQYGESAVDAYDPESWKYYMNLAGKYHRTDRPMYVISLDTKEEILFSPDMLIRHTATAQAYAHGTRFYYALVHAFPDQEFLINCILTPTNILTAIEAPDATILAYPKNLVEEYETTLIMELQNFIKVFNTRWNVEAFSLTDPYYAFMQRVVLGQQLLPKLLNLRTKRCKTSEVHSFHLTQYLASHHRLDRWLPYLTREQALWLYRNINYINHHAGSKEIFQSLIENLLDKRFIPLVELSIRQLQHFDSEGYPEIGVRRKQLSLAAPSSSEEFITLEELYLKESRLNEGNPLYIESHKGRMNHQMQTSSSSVLQTKDLESVMIDLSSSVPDSLEEVLMRQWVSMTHDGLYNVVVNFQDTKTSQEYSLSSWDAVIYMLYLHHKALKIPFDYVPEAYNVKYRLHPRPVVNDLLKFIEPGMEWLRPVAEELVRNQPALTECYSTTMFFEMNYQIYLECQRHWKLLAEAHDVYTRGALEQMILKLFGFQNRNFNKGEKAEVWRNRMNLPVYDYSYDEAQSLIIEIFNKATGYTIEDTKQLRYIQKALLDLFAHLSSYSIQIIREINDTPVIQAGGNALRVGRVSEKSENETFVGLGVHVLSLNPHNRDLTGQGDNLITEVIATRDVQYDHISLESQGSLEMHIQDNEVSSTSIRALDLDFMQETLDPVTRTKVKVPVKELGQLLSQSQLKKLIKSELFS